MRELGITATDPQAVARWCFEHQRSRNSARCRDGGPHSWIPFHDAARCVFCDTIIKL